MKVKEFFYNVKLRGKVTIMEVKFDELNPNNSYFVGTNPYKIDKVEDFDFNYYEIRNDLLKKYANMEIVSMSANSGDDGCTLNIGCIINNPFLIKGVFFYKNN